MANANAYSYELYEPSCEEVLKKARKAFTGKPHRIEDLWLALDSCATRHRFSVGDQAYLAEALSVAEQWLSSNACASGWRSVARLYAAIGMSLGMQGQWLQAESAFKKADAAWLRLVQQDTQPLDLHAWRSNLIDCLWVNLTLARQSADAGQKAEQVLNTLASGLHWAVCIGLEEELSKREPPFLRTYQFGLLADWWKALLVHVDHVSRDWRLRSWGLANGAPQPHTQEPGPTDAGASAVVDQMKPKEVLATLDLLAKSGGGHLQQLARCTFASWPWSDSQIARAVMALERCQPWFTQQDADLAPRAAANLDWQMARVLRHSGYLAATAAHLKRGIDWWNVQCKKAANSSMEHALLLNLERLLWRNVELAQTTKTPQEAAACLGRVMPCAFQLAAQPRLSASQIKALSQWWDALLLVVERISQGWSEQTWRCFGASPVALRDVKALPAVDEALPDEDASEGSSSSVGEAMEVDDLDDIPF